MINFLELLITYPGMDKEDYLDEVLELDDRNQAKWEEFSKISVERLGALWNNLKDYSSTLKQIIDSLDSVYELHKEVKDYYDDLKINNQKHLDPKICFSIEKLDYEIGESIQEFNECYKRLKENSKSMESNKGHRLF